MPRLLLSICISESACGSPLQRSTHALEGGSQLLRLMSVTSTSKINAASPAAQPRVAHSVTSGQKTATWNLWRCSHFAVPQMRRNLQFAFLSNTRSHNSQIPSLDHLPRSNFKLKRLSSLVAAIKFRPIRQRPLGFTPPSLPHTLSLTL